MIYDVQVLLSLLSFIFRVCVGSTLNKFGNCGGKAMPLGTALKSEVTSSVLGCARLCISDGRCQAANFDKNEKRCVLFGESFDKDCNELGTSPTNDFIYMQQFCHYGARKVNFKCQCPKGFLGNFCETRAGDCSAYTSSGLNVIHPYKNTAGNGITVFCSSMGARIFQGKGDNFPLMVSANWDSFHNGFGHPTDNEYWIGNKYIHEIMSDAAHTYELVFTVTNPNSLAFWQYYKDARITNEADNYTLHYGYATGVMDPLDMLPNHSPFRAFDHNDNGCVATNGAAFWYSDNCPVPSVMSGNYSWNGVIQSIRAFNGYINRL